MMCLVTVSCQTTFQSALAVGGPGHHIHKTRILEIISFEATSRIVYSAPTSILFRSCK